MLLTGVVMSLSQVKIQFQPGSVTWLEFMQAMESGTDYIIFVGAGIFFLISLEVRIETPAHLKALARTALSGACDRHASAHQRPPARRLACRYRYAASLSNEFTLDQLIATWTIAVKCSRWWELAALYLQRSDDAVVLSTVDEIEGLTTGLSRKSGRS